MKKAYVFGLEMPSEWLNEVESTISHHFVNLTNIQQSLNFHFLAVLTNFLDKTLFQKHLGPFFLQNFFPNNFQPKIRI